MKKSKTSPKIMTYNDFENKYFSRLRDKQAKEEEHRRPDFGQIIARRALDSVKGQFKPFK